MAHRSTSALIFALFSSTALGQDFPFTHPDFKRSEGTLAITGKVDPETPYQLPPDQKELEIKWGELKSGDCTSRATTLRLRRDGTAEWFNSSMSTGGARGPDKWDMRFFVYSKAGAQLLVFPPSGYYQNVIHQKSEKDQIKWWDNTIKIDAFNPTLFPVIGRVYMDYSC